MYAAHKIASSALHNIQESDCTGFNQPTGTQSYLLSAAMRTSEEELLLDLIKIYKSFVCYLQSQLYIVFCQLINTYYF